MTALTPQENIQTENALDTWHKGPFIISAHTQLESVYMCPDTPGDDAVENQAVQTWNSDPMATKNKEHAAVMQWHINGNDDGTYTIRSNPHWWPLVFDPDKDVTYARMVSKYTGDGSQRWHLTPITSAGGAYAISSALNPFYYMTCQNQTAVDNYVIMRPMWDGGPPIPPMIVATWYITPVPPEIQKLSPATAEPPA